MLKIKDVKKLMKNELIKRALENHMPSKSTGFKKLSSSFGDQIKESIQDALLRGKK